VKREKAQKSISAVCRPAQQHPPKTRMLTQAKFVAQPPPPPERCWLQLSTRIAGGRGWQPSSSAWQVKTKVTLPLGTFVAQFISPALASRAASKQVPKQKEDKRGLVFHFLFPFRFLQCAL